MLVTGATGYIGGRLVPRLVDLGHTVRCVARNAGRLVDRFPGVEIVEGDLFDRDALQAAMRDVDVAYYLVHSMAGSKANFAESDREAAAVFAEVAARAGVRRIIYLGGLGDETKALSAHLHSRHEVGEVLRSTGVIVTEFRAAVIVGSGSVSFEMIRYLTERLPLMITPKWVETRIQPIAVREVLAYLVAELDRPATESATFEIGGSEVMTYRDMMARYAAIRGLRRTMIKVPFFSPRVSSGWVHLMTPIPASIARPLIDGLRSEVIVHDNRARDVFPAIEPVDYETSVQRALDRYSTVGPETTWFDAYDVRSLPGEFAGVTEGMLIDRRQRTTRASAHALFTVFTSLGGKRGWLYADGLWELRGVLDRLVGGIGTRRGRRHASDLRVGDAVDFWRVEAYVPDSLLRLRAEMRLPGYAWLQFETLADGDAAGGASLRQTAFFEPRGIFGYLYWYSVFPFHGFIFGNMASRIAEEAEAVDAAARWSLPSGNGTARVHPAV